jgi:hypothetical protein
MQSAAAYDQRPLVPDDLQPARSLFRAAWAATTAEARQRNGADLCREIFPRDVLALQILTRAAISGANTTTPAWTGTLAAQVVGQFLASLAPDSAAAALMPRGVNVRLIQEGSSMVIPLATGAVAAAPWVGEMAAIPVERFTFSSGSVLTPKKLGAIVVMSTELARYSGAVAIFELMLRQQAAYSLDAGYFSAAAGSATTHPGLLNGLVAGTGTAIMADDLAKLAEAVAPPTGDLVFVMHPGRAAAADVRADITGGEVEILPSLAVPAGRVIAIDPASLIHGTTGDPEILATASSVLHMNDAPTDIGVAGAPATVAAPAQEMFQTAQVATRLLVDLGFLIRRAGAVAFMDGCTW